MNVAYGFYSLFNYLSVSTIEVSGEATTIAGLSQLNNSFLPTLDIHDVTTMLLRANPHIHSLTISKTYPRTITIFVQLEQPSAYLAVSQGYYVLNSKGKIIAKTLNTPGKHLISYYETIPYSAYRVGQTLSQQDILDAIYFLEGMRALRYTINNIDIKGFNMIGLVSSDKTFLFSAEKERDTQLFQLEEVVKELKKEGIDFETIDLRFNKPVVKFSK